MKPEWWNNTCDDRCGELSKTWVQPCKHPCYLRALEIWLELSATRSHLEVTNFKLRALRKEVREINRIANDINLWLTGNRKDNIFTFLRSVRDELQEIGKAAE